MRICYYISDHGLGHAARSAAVINTLAKRGHEIITINHTAQAFLQANLKTPLFDRKTDVGPVMWQQNTFGIDWPKTEVVVRNYLKKVDKLIKIERKFLETFDLVISDVVPHCIVAADEIGIPSILVSNFSWLSLYQGRLPDSLCQWFAHAYSRCTKQFQLPFEVSPSGVKKIKKIGLVARRTTASKTALKQKLKLPQSKKVIYLGFGGWNTKNMALHLPDGYTYLIAGKDFDEKTPNSQNYIAASDLVITKASYGTVAEAIAARVPLICATIPNSKETEITATEVSKKRLGISIKINDLLDIITLKNSINSAFELEPSPDSRLIRIGEEEAVVEIEQLK